MKVFGTIVLSIAVVIGALLFLMLSSCALARDATWSDRGIFGLIAMLDLGLIIAGVMAIGRWNRD